MATSKDEFMFMGKEVVMSEFVPEGNVFMMGEQLIMNQNKIDELTKMYKDMSSAATTTGTILEDYQKAVTQMSTTGTYYVSTDDTDWTNIGYSYNTPPSMGHTTSPTKFKITLNEPAIQTPPKGKCVLCNEEHESTMLSMFTDSYCDQCKAAIEKVREELFNEREDVYIHDINQLLEEQ